MKVVLVDSNMADAAMLALAIQKQLKVEVGYAESLGDTEFKTATLVIADPAPVMTKEWLAEFRRLHGSIPLILLSEQSDILSGSFKDPCYALSKPLDIAGLKELFSVIRYIGLGKEYPVGTQSWTKAN